MKIINGKDAVLGRLASYVAKELLKGEEIAVVNCAEAIITGNKKMIQEKFHEKSKRHGSSQKGPTHHKTSEKIVKRTIRGMLPDYRGGKGRDAFKRVKCYNQVPIEFKEKEMIQLKQGLKIKTNKIKEFAK